MKDTCLKNKVEKDTSKLTSALHKQERAHTHTKGEGERGGDKKQPNICQDLFNLATIFLKTKCHRSEDGSALAAKTDRLDFNSWNPDSGWNQLPQAGPLTCTLGGPVHIYNEPLKVHHRNICKKINVQGCLHCHTWQSLAKTYRYNHRPMLTAV